MKRFIMAMMLLGAPAENVWAQDPGDAPDQGVARISLLAGDVAVRRGDSGELIAAELNAPLVALDHVLTEEGSRAEIQFDWANIIRLAPGSEVRLAELKDGNFLVQVAVGTVTFRVLRDSQAEAEISTPTVSVRPNGKGTYRIQVQPDGSTEVTVRSGEAEVFTGRASEELRAGRTMQIRSDASNPEYTLSAAIPRDEWDRWNETRDAALERSTSYKYVSRDIYGADDLDSHGRWVYDAPYGWVWAPNVASTWAPYREGRWSWVNYYGWTWVSGDPWGWAPYHYGRWYHGDRYGWVWYPGVAQARYYWRPALVGFFGWGSSNVNISVGFGFGNVGWVPLAPYEVYRPWYGPGARNVIVNNVTVVNNVSILNTYRNARFFNGHNGVTSISSRDFGRNRITVNNFIRATDRDLVRGGDIRGRIPFEPSRESRVFSDRSPAPRQTARTNNNTQFVSRAPRGNQERIVRSGPQVQQDSRGRQNNSVQAAPARSAQTRGDRSVAGGDQDRTLRSGPQVQAESRGRQNNPVQAAPARTAQTRGERSVTGGDQDRTARSAPQVQAESRGRQNNSVQAATARVEPVQRSSPFVTAPRQGPTAGDRNNPANSPGRGRLQAEPSNSAAGAARTARGEGFVRSQAEQSRSTRSEPVTRSAPAAANRADGGAVAQGGSRGRGGNVNSGSNSGNDARASQPSPATQGNGAQGNSNRESRGRGRR